MGSEMCIRDRGVLVPITKKTFMVDLAQRIDLSVILVCRTALGTINHTLLSIEALRKREVDLVGVIFSGKINKWVVQTIKRITNVNVLGEIPTIKPLSRKGIDNFINTNNFAGSLKNG